MRILTKDKFRAGHSSKTWTQLRATMKVSDSGQIELGHMQKKKKKAEHNDVWSGSLSGNWMLSGKPRHFENSSREMLAFSHARSLS